MIEEISQSLLSKYEKVSWYRINILNCNHIKNTSILLFLLNFILFAIDYSNMKRGFFSENSAFILLFMSHLVLGLGTLTFVILYYKYKEKLDTIRYSRFYILGFGFFILNLAAFTSGWIDQLIHTEITVYVMGCFFMAFFIYQKPKYTLLLYIQSYVVFLVCLHLSQENSSIREAHTINSGLLVLLSGFVQIKISQFMQNYSIYKHNLEDMVEERTSELKASLEAVQKLDRLNIIGEMAATVGHEVRNPLTSIKGFLQLMREKQEDPVHLEYFDLMISEINRANSIITEFLSISRNKATRLTMGNLADAITSILPFIQADAAGKNMKILVDIQKVPDTLFNLREINQLVFNLSRNGLEAMKDNGCLTIKIYQLEDEVILAIQDQGPGMNQEILDNLGTPFFTTKDTGTGLGLVVCNSIVERHNARLNIKSSSEGSSFEVHFKIPAQEI